LIKKTPPTEQVVCSFGSPSDNILNTWSWVRFKQHFALQKGSEGNISSYNRLIAHGKKIRHQSKLPSR